MKERRSDSDGGSLFESRPSLGPGPGYFCCLPPPHCVIHQQCADKCQVRDFGGPVTDIALMVLTQMAPATRLP